MLKGVYLEAKDFVLTAVATDGYRFAMSKKALERKERGDFRHSAFAQSCGAFAPFGGTATTC